MSFKINRVYTRSGDDGRTALVGGAKVLKSSAQVCAYGEIDELNSLLGLVRCELTQATQALDPVLEGFQQELFDVGAEIASPPDAVPKGMWRVDEPAIKRLEACCDEFGQGLPELDSFILPGGSRLASLLHLARTVCRRAERSIVEMKCAQEEQQGATASAEVGKYMNRMSDALFVMARWALQAEGRESPLWVQASKRKQS